MTEPGRGTVIYAGVLLVLMLAAALASPFPFSLIAWGVAVVAALFLAVFVIVPLIRS